MDMDGVVVDGRSGGYGGAARHSSSASHLILQARIHPIGIEPRYHHFVCLDVIVHCISRYAMAIRHKVGSLHHV